MLCFSSLVLLVCYSWEVHIIKCISLHKQAKHVFKTCIQTAISDQPVCAGGMFPQPMLKEKQAVQAENWTPSRSSLLTRNLNHTESWYRKAGTPITRVESQLAAEACVLREHSKQKKSAGKSKATHVVVSEGEISLTTPPFSSHPHCSHHNPGSLRGGHMGPSACDEMANCFYIGKTSFPWWYLVGGVIVVCVEQMS